MVRFRATIQGQKGVVSGSGSAKSGMTVIVNGWGRGVEVEAFVDEEGCDRFRVWATNGSNGWRRMTPLMTC